MFLNDNLCVIWRHPPKDLPIPNALVKALAAQRAYEAENFSPTEARVLAALTAKTGAVSASRPPGGMDQIFDPPPVE